METNMYESITLLILPRFLEGFFASNFFLNDCEVGIEIFNLAHLSSNKKRDCKFAKMTGSGVILLHNSM